MSNLELSTIEELKSKLKQIDFYKQYPVMVPFVGDNYISNNHKRLLVVAESYYFSKDACMSDNSLYKSPDVWYKSTQNDIEDKNLLNWIDCNNLLSKKWNVKSGHKIYMCIEGCLRKANLESEIGKKLINEIAFTNFFIRPALEGQSFFVNDYCKKIDIEKSIDILTKVVIELKPDVIIFTSKRINDQLGGKIKKNDTL